MRARLWRVAQDVGTVTAREMPAGGVVVDLSGIQSEFLDALTEVFADGGGILSAQQQGGSATCTLNAADEIGVQAFLEGRIPFPAIAEVVEETLDRQPNVEATTIEEVISVDLASRKLASGR